MLALTVDVKEGRNFAVGITSAIASDDYDLYVYYPDGTEAALDRGLRVARTDRVDHS